MVTTGRSGTRIRVASSPTRALEVIARRNTTCEDKETAREKGAYESRNGKINDGSSAAFVVHRLGESRKHTNEKGVRVGPLLPVVDNESRAITTSTLRITWAESDSE